MMSGPSKGLRSSIHPTTVDLPWSTSDLSEDRGVAHTCCAVLAFDATTECFHGGPRARHRAHRFLQLLPASCTVDTPATHQKTTRPRQNLGRPRRQEPV